MKVVCDIDGVVYRGDELIQGSDTALRRIIESDIGLLFATNNSTRTPDEVRDRIARMAGVEVSVDSIVTSSQAAAYLLSGKEAPVFIFGSDAIRAAMDEYSIPTTGDPDAAEAVVVGLDRDLSYGRLAGAMRAVRSGARFVATNVDPTLPVANDFLPGAGAMVAALVAASGMEPEVAGKPHRPMCELLRSRGVDQAWVIGDRIDTDVALAATERDWRSILVLSGVSDGGNGMEADHVVPTFAAAVDLILGNGKR